MILTWDNIFDFVLEDNFVSKAPNYLYLLTSLFPNYQEELQILWAYGKRIVFGVKLNKVTGDLEHEFYVYNNRLDCRPIHPADILKAFPINDRLLSIPNKLQNCFMYSWNFDIDSYIRYIDYYMPDAMSYRYDGGIISKRNHYSFFSKNNISQAENLLDTYTNSDSKIKDLLRVFGTYLVDTGKICIADKRERGIESTIIDLTWSDFIHFSGYFSFQKPFKIFSVCLIKRIVISIHLSTFLLLMELTR